MHAGEGESHVALERVRTAHGNALEFKKTTRVYHRPWPTALCLYLIPQDWASLAIVVSTIWPFSPKVAIDVFPCTISFFFKDSFKTGEVPVFKNYVSSHPHSQVQRI